MAYYRYSRTRPKEFDLNLIDALWEINLNFLDEDDECDFFCLECSRMHNCIAYSEIKEEWESFYT